MVQDVVNPKINQQPDGLLAKMQDYKTVTRIPIRLENMLRRVLNRCLDGLR